MFSCFKKKEEIVWKNCQPFVPPIKKGYVIKVYDGDTITVASKLPYIYSPLYRFQIRLTGIDSPEIKSKCEKEKQAALVSRKALEELILHKTVYLKDIQQEKYGRILCNIYINNGKKDLLCVNQWLLENNYAVPYDGKTKLKFVSS